MDWLKMASLAAGLAVALSLGCSSEPRRPDFLRRLPVVKTEGFDHLDLFFATNRAADQDIYHSTSPRLGSRLSTGVFRARIAPEISIGEHAQPVFWRREETVRIDGVEEIPGNRFYQKLKQAVNASPRRSLLIIVWGWKDSFESAALKTAYTAYVLDMNTPVLLFDWPGNQGDSPLGYIRSRKLAKPAGAHLGEFLGKVIGEIAPENLWISSSSLGCQVVCDAFEWMYERADLADQEREVAHVILAAPDVADDEFDARFKSEIGALSKQVTAYVSSNDQALLLSHWLNRSRRLGRRPTEEPDQFEEMRDLLELQLSGAQGISVVDVTPINNKRNMHHFFTDSVEFFDDLYQRLLLPPPLLHRRLYSVRYKGEVQYWILWGDD